MGEEEQQQQTPDEQLRQLFGKAEKQTAAAVEQLVHRDSFGELLVRVTENVMQVTKIGFGVLDLTVRSLRLAGRADLTRLGRQLARNEDKLERVLEEVERLQDQVSGIEQSSGSQSRSRSNSRSSSAGSNSSTRRRSSSSNGRSRSGGSSGNGSSRSSSSGSKSKSKSGG
jgi:hypothetical protein